MNARPSTLALVLSIACGVHAQNVTINWNDVHQKMNGFGGGTGCFGAYRDLNPGTGEGWYIRNLPEPLQTKCFDLLFDSTKGIGLSLIKMGESWELEDPDGTWHWGAGRGPQEVWEVKEALKRNANIKLWSNPPTPPLWMKTQQSMGGGELQTQYYQRYADYVSHFIRDMRDKEGITLMANSVINEPQNGSASYGGCTYSGEQLRTFVRDYLGPTFKRDGLDKTTTIMIPESNYGETEYAMPTINDPAALAYVGILGWHQYNDGPTPTSVAGTESWMTEISHNPYNGMGDVGWGEALWVHSQLYGALVSHDASVWMYFILAGGGNGGLLKVYGTQMDTTGKAFWWVGHYSKFVRQGWVRIGTSVTTSNGLKLSAFKDPRSGRFAFIIANEGISKPGPTVTVICQGFTPVKVSAYLTPGEDQAAHLVGPTNVPITSGKFTYTIPNVSIATLVGETQAVGTYRAIATQTPVRMHAMRVPLGLRVVMDQPVRGRAELLDSRGRMVARWDIAAVAQQTLRLSRPLSNGVHMLRVRDNGEHDGYIGVVN